jgi:hypothetical protein
MMLAMAESGFYSEKIAYAVPKRQSMSLLLTLSGNIKSPKFK